jgi:hypothetical protein
MKRLITVLIVLILLTGSIPTLSGPDYRDYSTYREYREDLYELQYDITQVYVELHQRKNPQAVYEHILQTIEKTSVSIGKAHRASQDIHDRLQISLQDHLEIILILGLSENQKENLSTLGYTEDDVTDLVDFLLHYNDYYHHVKTGFTPEEMEQFLSVGLTDDQISELHHILGDHYTEWFTAQQVVKEHQIELMQAQVLLSVAALQTLLESCTDTKDKKDKDKPENRIKDAEEKLLNALSNLSWDQSSLEKVKAYSKHVYKAAEQEIIKGNTQYMVDFFVGLQVHCGSVTALNGDIELGLKEIRVYEDVLLECVTNEERQLLQSVFTRESPMGEESLCEQSIPTTDCVGQIEEFSETNNLGVVTVFVKAPDTTLLQFLVMLSLFVFLEFGEAGWSITLPQLVDILGTITASAVVTKVTIVSGAFFLLIVTAPSVGLEWPPAVPGWIEGEEVIIIVEGSYGQAHITERAESKDPCIASSHQAILDTKYMIQDIVVYALKLLYNEDSGQYIYYYIDDSGKEWGVFIRKYKDKYYELRTAYRVDCGPPFKCGVDGKNYNTIIDKWICEGFRLISLW